MFLLRNYQIEVIWAWPVLENVRLPVYVHRELPCKRLILSLQRLEAVRTELNLVLGLMDLRPERLTNLLKSPSCDKWQNQYLAPKTLEDLLQNVAFALVVPHFKFLLVPTVVLLVSWHLSFPLDVIVAEWWVNWETIRFLLHHGCCRFL